MIIIIIMYRRPIHIFIHILDTHTYTSRVRDELTYKLERP